MTDTIKSRDLAGPKVDQALLAQARSGPNSVSVDQPKGWTYRFTGTLIGYHEKRYEGDGLRIVTTQLWETVGGNFIAVSLFWAERGRGFEKATLIEGDLPTMEFRTRVMDALEWTWEAQAMAKEMGWRMVMEVE